MRKDIIRDGKKVRLCDSNIAKANPFTYHIYFTKWWQFLFPIAPPKDFFVTILQAVVWVLQILPWGWIVSLAYAYNHIRRVKKDIARRKRRTNS